MNITIAASKETAPPGGSSVLDIPLERIRESTTNPRRVFDEIKLREFADNIRLHGVLQAVLVRPAPDGEDGEFELVAGARRFRASKLAAKSTIPATVRDLSDSECREIQLVENLQREGVHELDEGIGYRSLMDLKPDFYAVEKLVQTGLDLIDFPTILFYETGYSIYVLRQASRRSWRIGQRLPVKVKFLHYAETMQESCLRLMGKKLLVSLAMEGKFSSEGLQSINDEDDILMAMARELVTEKGIGERADAVWAKLQKTQDDMVGTRKPEDVEGTAEQTVPEIPLDEPTVTQVDQWSALKSAVDLSRRKGSRRSTSATPDEQLALF